MVGHLPTIGVNAAALGLYWPDPLLRCVTLDQIQACQETISSLQLTKQAQERQIAVRAWRAAGCC